MISRVEWLKHYEKIVHCSQANIKFCSSFSGCKDCPFNIDSDDEIDRLLEAAAEIFKSQIMTEEGIIDDGK